MCHNQQTTTKTDQQNNSQQKTINNEKQTANFNERSTMKKAMNSINNQQWQNTQFIVGMLFFRFPVDGIVFDLTQRLH